MFHWSVASHPPRPLRLCYPCHPWFIPPPTKEQNRCQALSAFLFLAELSRAGGSTPLHPPVFLFVCLTAIRFRSVRSAHTVRRLRSRAPPYCSLRAYACGLR
jgi:hypothetical protein